MINWDSEPMFKQLHGTLSCEFLLPPYAIILEVVQLNRCWSNDMDS